MTYGAKEGFGKDRGVRRRWHFETSDAIDHFAQADLARDFQSMLIFQCDAASVLMQSHKIALCITFQHGMLVHMGNCCGPGSLVMTCRFLKAIRQALDSAFVFNDRHAFHEVGYGD